MKHLDEYRDAPAIRRLAAELAAAVTRPWAIMEVCGGQTHSILRFGLDQLLPPGLELLHGPGCPVCVTPAAFIDHALELAARPEVTLCSFGDMLRVPGEGGDLMHARARGGDIRIVYSPLDALALARSNPDRQVVFFAVGFETTAPATALAVRLACDEHLPNFSLLVAHVLIPPVLEVLLDDAANRVQAFLAPGHVCTVAGWDAYDSLARRRAIPIVVAGFEPVDLLDALLRCVRRLESSRPGLENAYPRAVRRAGNPHARALIDEVYEPEDRHWRGLGLIPAGGLRLRPPFASFDALQRFGLATRNEPESELCRAGLVLRGVCRPLDCPAFGRECIPEHPLGAPMVSSEGACAAYYRYRHQGSFTHA